MRTSREPRGRWARKAAVDLLCGRDAEGAAGRDRDFAFLLEREAVAWRLRLDAALAPLCSRPLSSLQLEVLSALRIGAVQLLVLGTPAHAAVSATVDACPPRARSLVNAVLRRLASDGEPRDLPPWIAQSHPRELWERWAGRYGAEGAGALMRWDNSPPVLGCFCPGREVEGAPGRYLEGYRYLERSGRLDSSGMDGIYVQDEGAALVAAGAAGLPGGTVLDICAAPGGKTAHLALTGGTVLSIDSSLERMKLWKENARRLSWKQCLPVVADCTRLPVESADKAVVDAPCTGTGVLRRRTDARWGFSSGLLGKCTALQAELLDAAAGCVRPGGSLVYSVCSLEPEESTMQVSRFEEAHPGFRREEFPAPGVLVRDGMLCIFPPEHGIDGHFAVRWERMS